MYSGKTQNNYFPPAELMKMVFQDVLIAQMRATHMHYRNQLLENIKGKWMNMCNSLFGPMCLYPHTTLGKTDPLCSISQSTVGGETARWAEVTARLASSQLQLLKHLHRNTQGVSSGVISAQCSGETNTAFLLSLWNLQVVVRDFVSKKNTFVLISARQGNQAV